jgi:hypothetical protein
MKATPPYTAPSEMRATLSLLGVGLAAALALAGCEKSPEQLEQERIAQQQAQQQPFLEIVRARLKDPGSASFQNVALVDTGGKQALCGEVNAKSSFGGYNGYQAFLVADGAVTFVGANKVERYKVWPQMNAAGCGRWFAEYELRVPVGQSDNSVSDALDDAEARLRGLK